MKLSEIEDRIVALEKVAQQPVSFDSLFRRVEALEKAVANSQQCPADPCHVHCATVAATPKYDVTQESWTDEYVRDGSVWTADGTTRVCVSPAASLAKDSSIDTHWQQRRVLIAHAPEMYRELVNLEQLIRYIPMTSKLMQAYTGLQQLLDTIQKELKESE